MIEVSWEDRFCTGIEKIDLQHRNFVGLINHIASIDKDRASDGEMDGLLLELYKYADYHFCSEENHMRSIGYPDAEAHRMLHNGLLAELQERIQRSEAGTGTVAELLRFLFLWFATHTTDEDARVARFSRGA